MHSVELINNGEDYLICYGSRYSYYTQRSYVLKDSDSPLTTTELVIIAFCKSRFK